MGYAYYVLSDGREAGYSVEAACDQKGCDEKIDRGLAYLCGIEPEGDEYACGGYFCAAHLSHASGLDYRGSLCESCLDAVEVNEAARRSRISRMHRNYRDRARRR